MRKLAAIWIVIVAINYSCQKEEVEQIFNITEGKASLVDLRTTDESVPIDYCISTGEKGSQVHCEQSVFSRLDFYLRNYILDCRPELSPCGSQECYNPLLVFYYTLSYDVDLRKEFNFDILIDEVNLLIAEEVERYFGINGYPCRIEGSVLSYTCNVGKNEMVIELNLIDLCEV